MTDFLTTYSTYHYESDIVRRNITIETLFKLARGLNVNPGDLLLDRKEMEAD